MIAAGYEDSNDADKLRRDPRCMLALERAPETETAQCSLPTISRIEDMADTHTLFRMGHEMVRVYCASLKKSALADRAGYRRHFRYCSRSPATAFVQTNCDEYGFQPILVFGDGGVWWVQVARSKRWFGSGRGPSLLLGAKGEPETIRRILDIGPTALTEWRFAHSSERVRQNN